MHVSRDLTAEALNHRIAQRGEREERGGGPAAVAVRHPSHALHHGGARGSEPVRPGVALLPRHTAAGGGGGSVGGGGGGGKYQGKPWPTAGHPTLPPRQLSVSCSTAPGTCSHT